jgi:hypothetical protein
VGGGGSGVSGRLGSAVFFGLAVVVPLVLLVIAIIVSAVVVRAYENGELVKRKMLTTIAFVFGTLLLVMLAMWSISWLYG